MLNQAATLENIANIIKTEVGQYDSDVFSEYIVSIIRELTAPWNSSVVSGMVSPFRQLLYLLNLNLTSAELPTKKTFLDNQDWKRLVELVNEMDEIHQKNWGEFKPFAEELVRELDEEEMLSRRLIGVPAAVGVMASFARNGVTKIHTLSYRTDDLLDSTGFL